MRPIQILSFLSSLLSVAVQHVAASFASSILYPNASSVWYRDYTHNVTWDTSALPAGAGSPIIRLFKNGEDTAQILAKDFDLARGRVEVHVPWVTNGSDYQIRMFFDSSSPSTNNWRGQTNTSAASTDCWMTTSANSSTASADPSLTASSTPSTTTDGSAANANTTTATSMSSTVILPVDIAASNSTAVSASTDAIVSATLVTTDLLSNTTILATTASSTATGSSPDSHLGRTATGTDTTITTAEAETSTTARSSATNATSTSTSASTSSSSAAAPSSSGSVTGSSDDPVTFFMSAPFTIAERPDVQGTTGNNTTTNGTSTTPPQGMVMGRRWRYKRAPAH